MSVTRTFATVLLTGKDLARDDVAPLLHSTPSSYDARGDRMGNGPNIWQHGQWRLESETHVESDDLADHLDWLLEQIAPHEELIREIVATGVNGWMSCFVQTQGFNSGIVLPPDVLASLGTAHLELHLDLYPMDCDEGSPF